MTFHYTSYNKLSNETLAAHTFSVVLALYSLIYWLSFSNSRSPFSSSLLSSFTCYKTDRRTYTHTHTHTIPISIHTVYRLHSPVSLARTSPASCPHTGVHCGHSISPRLVAAVTAVWNSLHSWSHHHWSSSLLTC